MGISCLSMHRSSSISWLKPLALFVGGILLVIYPLSGITVITWLVSFYLFTGAFDGIGVALFMLGIAVKNGERLNTKTVVIYKV